MTYSIEITGTAEKQLKRIGRPEQIRLRDAIRGLAQEPRPQGFKKLKERDGYRIRVGAYRVIYDIADQVLRVLVFKVGHRRDVYR